MAVGVTAGLTGGYGYGKYPLDLGEYDIDMTCSTGEK